MVQIANKNEMQNSERRVFLFFVYYLPLCKLKIHAFVGELARLVSQASVLGTGLIGVSLAEKPSSAKLLQFIGPTLACDTAKFLATSSVITGFCCVLQSSVNQLEYLCLMLKKP